MVRVAINGFGRIGRRVFRLLQSHPTIQVVAINDLADPRTLAHLLKYDSIHGTLKRTVSSNDTHIIIGEKSIPVLNKTEPKNLNWTPYGVDIVIEATGKFKSKSDLIHHINNGASKVILSVPPSDDDLKTVVLGVNDDLLQNDDLIISNASCTTNNAAPMLSIINTLCGINQAYITTVHSYTTDQSLHDQPH
ncbi:MAG: glyceraldehyde 3-phosphate dehydrogenase NAD-binding domain-containing protein, partial [Flavobacteriaceae bacterium]|nr:glyceraldehyde 3-phosphate dehydrogenase NAD-binding domain-containing protein [Flavobacteriaceae bacterium]